MIALVSALVFGSSVEQLHRDLDDWQLEPVFSAAEQLLREDPHNPEVWALGAQIQHARGYHLSALSLAQAAVQAGDGKALVERGLVARIESSARYAQRFDTLETDHFRISYAGKDRIVATYAAPVLEKTYAAVSKALEFEPIAGTEKIAVEIYPDARGLAGATGLTVNEIQTSGTIAVCKFHRLMITSPLATAGGYGWADTIAHEFIHLVISKKSRNTIPIWLHEGIAKYYESTWKGQPGLALSAHSEKLLAQATRSGKFITYAQMHPSMAKLPSQEDAALAFAEVFTTIEFLTKKFGPRSVPKVLALAGKGVALEAALKKVFGMGLGQIEKAWRRYLRARPFRDRAGAKPRRIQLVSNEKPQQERALETMDDPRVHTYARLGEMLQLRGHHKAAIVEYTKAYDKSGARYPTLVYRLARAHEETGQRDAAHRVLKTALKIHPEDMDLRMLAGRLLRADGKLEQAKPHFEQARLQNPFNPELHEALAHIYDAQGKPNQASMEREFAAASRTPRARQVAALPPVTSGGISLVAPRWWPVRLAGQAPIETPAWNIALDSAGAAIEYVAPQSNTPRAYTLDSPKTGDVVFLP